MSQYLIDSEIRLGQCNRCESYVFMAMSSGVRSAADPAPVSHDGFVAALTDGRRLFRLQEATGRPQKLLEVRPADLHPSWGPGGAQQGAQSLLAEHGCGGHQRNMITFTEVEQGPCSVHAKPGSSRVDGPRPQAAPAAGTNPFAVAHAASHRPSDGRCGTCGRHVRAGEIYWGIQHGPVWIYCEHEECP